MAIERKYTDPLQVVETAETRRRIIAIANIRRVSQAEVIRGFISAGLPAEEARLGISRE